MSQTLDSLGLPSDVVDCYKDCGIRQLFPWQAECLRLSGISRGETCNLVFSAPTSAGKTLVAEILVLTRVLGPKSCKALLVLPYISVAREKMLHLQVSV